MSQELQLDGTGSGVFVPVFAVPRAGRSEVDGVHDGAIRVRLKAPPVDGAANAELCKFVAKLFGVPKRDVRVRSGLKSRRKVVEITGISRDDANKILTDVLGQV